MQRNLLIAKDISFSIQDKVILNPVNLSLSKGKITIIIGPNGAGKSTLMRILSGYIPVSAGTCLFRERKLTEYTPGELAQYRAVMRQHSQLNFPFSVEEVIKMGGYHRRRSDVEAYLPTILALTDCDSLKNKPYRQLSGGEQQRTQLARALLQLWDNTMQGKLLFLDEPTSALDLYHQQQCLRLMRQLCQEKGLTVCCVLHDLNLAALYGDHIVLLANQQLQAQGTPEQIIFEPLIQQWYKADIQVHRHPINQAPQVIFKP